MQRKRSRLMLAGVLALALSVTAGLTLGGIAEAKKQKNKSKGGQVNVNKAVNLPIPDATPIANGVLLSEITVGKQFKGLKIRDVNATVQTTGSDVNSANDLELILTAPNGATSVLSFGFSGQNVGPLTFDDETARFIGGTVANSPYELAVPYIGTAQPDGKPLAIMDNGAVRGKWTLAALDTSSGGGDINSLLNWSLSVASGPAFATK
jgi:hypothetical protein